MSQWDWLSGVHFNLKAAKQCQIARLGRKKKDTETYLSTSNNRNQKDACARSLASRKAELDSELFSRLARQQLIDEYVILFISPMRLMYSEEKHQPHSTGKTPSLKVMDNRNAVATGRQWGNN